MSLSYKTDPEPIAMVASSKRLLLVSQEGGKEITNDELGALLDEHYSLTAIRFPTQFPLDYADDSWDAIVWRIENKADTKWLLEESQRMLVRGGRTLLVSHLEPAVVTDIAKNAENLGIALGAKQIPGNRVLLRFDKSIQEADHHDSMKVCRNTSIKRERDFISENKSLPSRASIEGLSEACVERVYALGKTGVLIFGWHYSLVKPKAIVLHGSDGESIILQDDIFWLDRADVVETLKEKFPEIPTTCGFCCRVSLPTQPGDFRLLSINYGTPGRLLLGVPCDGQGHGIPAVKEILHQFTDQGRCSAELHGLIEKHLGPAFEVLQREQQGNGIRKVNVHQFGIAPVSPTVTAIIPLFGRYDFLRHQLAQFADDPDFYNVDILYIVDNPTILYQTLDLAASIYPVFGVPFRVLNCGASLGYAAANNIGARHALAETLLLLKSDVLPKSPGWVAKLKQALATLPDAGAVSPLLQFYDDSIQHAGMNGLLNERLPGFLLNDHPGKGMRWLGPDRASEHLLLTAACLMLKQTSYLDAGGFDEAYISGTFEDRDLCLALRKTGQRLWLVPEVKLWHLERQSLSFGIAGGAHQLLNLYNSWRYQKKISEGQILDPMVQEVEICAS